MAKYYPIRLSITWSIVDALVNLVDWLGKGAGHTAYLVQSAIVLFLLDLACWLVLFLILRAYPTHNRWLDLVLAAFCCGSLASIFYSVQVLLSGDSPEPLGESPAMQLLGYFHIGLILFSIICPMAWFFEKMRRTQEERIALEHLKVENLKVRLNSLQQQMSPHFLFNCLNVLKSGAKEEWAKDYVMQLSRVYRYLLTLSHESRLVTLEEELRFAMAYGLILCRRLGGAFNLTLDAAPGAGDLYIPPLALQTLIENAIGNDALSLAKPLHVRIFVDGEWLVVKDNFFAGGRETGLQNLQERYRLLGGISPVFVREASDFTIKLPLFNDPGTYFRG
jgi:two-component system LytT family sensor kinase